MGYILKIAAGLYVFSVLAFSSWSRASDGFYPLSTSEISIGAMSTIAISGVVFEEDGYLYFQTTDHNIILIHSNSFSFFEDSKLPQDVYIEGQSIDRNNEQNGLNAVVQITLVSFLDK